MTSRTKIRQFLYSAWILAATVFLMYRDFIRHPDYRGSNFNWLVPFRIAYQQWRIY